MKTCYLLIFFIVSGCLLKAMDDDEAIFRKINFKNEIPGLRATIYCVGFDERARRSLPTLTRTAINCGESKMISMLSDQNGLIMLSLVGAQMRVLRRPERIEPEAIIISVEHDGIHFEDEIGMLLISDLE